MHMTVVGADTAATAAPSFDPLQMCIEEREWLVEFCK